MGRISQITTPLHPAPPADDRPAAAMLGAGFDRVVSVVAWVMATGTVLLLAGSEAGVVDTGIPRPWLLGIGIPVAVLHIIGGLTPWRRISETATGQYRFELYPIIVLLLVGPLPAFVAGSPVLALMMLLTAAIGALGARPRAALLLVAIPTLSIALSLIRSTAPNILIGTAFLIFSPLSVWLSVTTGRLHRQILAKEVAERLASEQQGDALRTIAASARSIQHLEPARVLQGVADAALEIGWVMCGIYVPAQEGEGYILGGHAGLDPDLALKKHQPIGVLGEILRTGQTSILENYAQQPNANPDYPQLRTAVGSPVFVHGVQRGAIVVGCVTLRHVAASDVGILELLADQAGRALELAEQYERQQATVVELERVNQLKQDFLATVSHELRTPLAVVLGMAETMTRRWDDLDEGLRRDMTRRLHANAAGLETVIEALLDFSRIESGIIQPRRKDVALIDLASHIVERLQTVTTKHDVAVEVHTGPNVADGLAWCDPLLLERVIENLITNACRHTPAGSSVRIRFDQFATTTFIEVADNGPGIPADELERLCERFYRGGDPLTRSTRGLGLGLSFCREVLELHGSELRIDSTVGEGSSFHFALPRTSNDHDVSAAAVAAASADDEVQHPALAVDDLSQLGALEV